MKNALPKLFVVSSLAWVAACGGSSSGSSTNSNPCSGNFTFASITSAAGSDASCPMLTASQLNSSSGDDAGSGGNSCKPAYSSSGGVCSMTFNCTDNGVTVTGSATSSGTTAAGSFTVLVNNVMCSYNFSGTVSP